MFICLGKGDRIPGGGTMGYCTVYIIHTYTVEYELRMYISTIHALMHSI